MTVWITLLLSAPAQAHHSVDANGPYTVDAGGTVALSASVSGCVSGGSSRWDFNNDGSSDASGRDTNFTATGYDGPTQITVTFWNDCGLHRASDTATINIDNVAPVITSITGNVTVNEGESNDYGYVFTDAEAADTHTVLVDMDDGTQFSSTPFSHAWADDGVYDITVTVTDDDGGSDQEVLAVTVNNVAPTLTSSTIPTNGNEGEVLAFEALGSDVPADAVQYLWEFDIGGTDDTDNNASTVYSYPDDGQFNGKITLTDGDGGSFEAPFIVQIANLPPTVDSSTIPTTGAQGEVLDFSAIVSDPGTADVLTVSWNFGDGNVGSGTSTTHSYAQPGNYVVTVTVDDGDGGSDFDTGAVDIGNTPPTIDSTNYTNTGDEGQMLTFEATASDGNGSVGLEWDFGDGQTANGSPVQHSWADNGDFTVKVTATDQDNAMTSYSELVSISNVAPTVTLTGDTDDSGGVVLSWNVSVDDPGSADTHTISWDFGDGNTLPNGSISENHTFAQNGVYTVTVTVEDDDGGIGTDDLVVGIGSVGPTLNSLTGDTTGDEGADLTWLCDATDSQGTGSLTYSWQFGDGGTDGNVTSATHAYDDNGNYTVTCTVEDGLGLKATATLDVAVANVAPVVGGTPPSPVPSNIAYDFVPTVTDAAGDTHTWSGTGAAGSTIDPGTGKITWTPVASGTYNFTIIATDDDGAPGQMMFSVEVQAADNDNDGIPDLWETQNNLDPNDPNDWQYDPDGDGRDNFDEFYGGTDPQVNESPTNGALVSPVDNALLTEFTPTLVVENGSSPIGDTLVYDFFVYTDPGGNTVYAQGTGVAEGGNGETSWVVSPALAEDVMYYWTANVRAAGFDSPPAPAVRSMVASLTNDAPSAPTIVSPSGGTVPVFSPDLVVSEATDPEGDPLTYTFVLYSDDGPPPTENGGGTGVVSGGQAVWTTDWTLTDAASYCWYAYATDDGGLDGPDSTTACFQVNFANNPPPTPTIVWPPAGVALATAQPTIEIGHQVDPEGHLYFLDVEIDIVSTFDSTDIFADPGNLPTAGVDFKWTPAALDEDTRYYFRVKARDEHGASSAWASTNFLIDAINETPSVPRHISPDSGAQVLLGDSLIIASSKDFEDDDLTYDFEVTTSAGDPAWGINDVPDHSSGRVEVVPRGLEAGIYLWKARAKDANSASEWSNPTLFEFIEGEIEDTTSRTPHNQPDDGNGDVDDLAKLSAGCSCDAGSMQAGWGLLLLAVLARRQRHSSTR